MDSIQEQTTRWSEAGTKKGLKMPVKGTESDEIFLSKVKLVCESAGVKPIVKRQNGSGFQESAVTTLDERISRHMAETGASYRESHIYLTGKDCGRDKVQPKSFTESLAAKWRKYAPFLSEDEVQQLATRGVQP